MQTDSCPQCGAAVRRGAAWCSLCYLDLRPAPRPVTLPAARSANPADSLPGMDVVAPVVDAALEPRPPNWPASGPGDVIDVIDAECITGQADDLHWPCTCGAWVAMEHTVCPTCGSEFLAGLRTEGAGRHRRGSRRQRRSAKSRAVRLSLAALTALIVAVGIPTLLALLG